jgi:hypothetical protein
MQPLSGRNLSDWIRSEAVITSRVPFIVIFIFSWKLSCSLFYTHVSTGATTSGVCRLCDPGTYQTRSGQML